ncbi:MAG: transporter [Candidatus Thorarchaeota archaeon]|nr:MAG: transporter [Candidatus Thorarchaeota archaeon]
MKSFKEVDKIGAKGFKLYDVFLAAFVALLLLSNIIAVKLIAVGPIVLTAAVFLFPLSYIFGDVLTEVYGYARSRRMIWLGFAANILMVLAFWLAISLPAPVFWKNQEALVTVLGSVPRIVLASLIAYWVGEFMNSYVLARMKEWMIKWDPNHKHLWMRTIGSTIVGEGLDSILFVIIGFFGTMPFGAVLMMIFWQWVFKCGIEIVFTPLTYKVVATVKKVEGVDTIGAATYSPLVFK